MMLRDDFEDYKMYFYIIFTGIFKLISRWNARRIHAQHEFYKNMPNIAGNIFPDSLVSSFTMFSKLFLPSKLLNLSFAIFIVCDKNFIAEKYVGETNPEIYYKYL